MMTIRIIGAAIATATSGRLGRLAEPMASVRSTGRIILLARGVGLVGAFGLAAVGLKLAEPLGAAAPLAFTAWSLGSPRKLAITAVPQCTASSAKTGLMSGSMRSGPDTALLSWSGTVISGTPPKYSNARAVEAMNSSRSCERVASA
jgi:hypothetical protein